MRGIGADPGQGRGDERLVHRHGTLRRHLSAELAIALEGPGPEAALPGHDRVAHRIHRHQRTDLEPVGGHRRDATEPALQRTGLGAEPGAGIAQGEIGRRRRASLAPEPRIGRRLAPSLVAAIQQIEQDRRRHQGNARRADGKPDPARREPSHRRRGRLQPEGGAAAQHHRVDLRNQAGGIERVGLARPRRAAADIDRRHRRGLGQHDRHPGPHLSIFGIADADAGDVGDEIARSRSDAHAAIVIEG